jgi:hypothetical protein
MKQQHQNGKVTIGLDLESGEAGFVRWIEQAKWWRKAVFLMVLRFFGFIPWAATSFLTGALISRFGWIAAGRISGFDLESVFAAERFSANGQ